MFLSCLVIYSEMFRPISAELSTASARSASQGLQRNWGEGMKKWYSRNIPWIIYTNLYTHLNVHTLLVFSKRLWNPLHKCGSTYEDGVHYEKLRGRTPCWINGRMHYRLPRAFHRTTLSFPPNQSNKQKKNGNNKHTGLRKDEKGENDKEGQYEEVRTRRWRMRVWG